MSLPPLVEPAADLSIEEVRRYSRHLIIPDVGMDGQKRLKNAKVLVIGDPKVEVTGNVRSEYNNREYKRQVYNGSGKIVVDGKFEAIQFFGRNVSGTWNGWGLVRFYGEFDKDLNTGDYWYPDKPNEKFPWGNYGSTAFNPKQVDAMQQNQPKPVVVPPKKKG